VSGTQENSAWMITRLPNGADGGFQWDGRSTRAAVQRVGQEDWPSVEPLAGIDDIAKSLTVLNGSSRGHDYNGGHTSRVDWFSDPLWNPEPRPTGEHDWDLVLAVDGGRSMSIWNDAVADFIEALRRRRSFRAIDVFELDTDVLEPGRVIPRQPVDPRMASEIALPGGSSPHRMALVLTDGLGPAWSTGAMLPLLRRWGNGSSVAIVHLLPEHLWSITGINPVRTQLRARAPGSPNAAFDWVDDRPPATGEAFPLPVLELDVRWLRTWAALLVRSPNWWSLPVLMAGPEWTVEDVLRRVGDDERTPTAAEQVSDFRSSASAMAFTLATYLAAAPLNIPVMRLVQATLLPHSRPFHLSEILASGLLTPVTPSAGIFAFDRITFEFPPGVREELLAVSRRSQTHQVARVVVEHLGRHVPAVQAFGDVLWSPSTDEVPVPRVTPENLPYLRVLRAILDALSGRYRAVSQRLRTELAGYRD
jgi:hypothetical protein